VYYSYVSFDDYRLWNKWFRVWGIVISHAGAAALRLLTQFNQTKEDKAFRTFIEKIMKNGFPINDDVFSFFAAVCSVMADYDERTIDATKAEGRLQDIIDDFEHLPPNFPYADSAQNFPIINKDTESAIKKWLGEQ